MIKINSRKVSNYVNIEIEIDGFKKDMGLFDDEERLTLISELEEIVDDLKGFD
jgi:hypothetical protein